jgi:hypothetical protein
VDGGESSAGRAVMRPHHFCYHHCIMPRTTIDLDEPILEELKRIQKEEGGSLGAVASSLLADALAARKKPKRVPRLRWIVRNMGPPRVPLEDKDALWDILDDRYKRDRE